MPNWGASETMITPPRMTVVSTPSATGSVFCENPGPPSRGKTRKTRCVPGMTGAGSGASAAGAAPRLGGTAGTSKPGSGSTVTGASGRGSAVVVPGAGAEQVGHGRRALARRPLDHRRQRVGRQPRQVRHVPGEPPLLELRRDDLPVPGAVDPAPASGGGGRVAGVVAGNPGARGSRLPAATPATRDGDASPRRSLDPGLASAPAGGAGIAAPAARPAEGGSARPVGVRPAA